MKKLALIVLSAVAIGIPAPPAEAKSIVGARVNPNPEAVRAYWTPARMANAIPAERRRVPFAKPGTGGAATPWSTLKIGWPASAATYANGKVFFTDSGASYVCSGTAVQSTNESVVWTAGHCVHDGPGDFHTNWLFKPAYNSDRSLGTFAASHLYTPTAWATSGEFGRDLGAAVVSAANGTLTATVGATRSIGIRTKSKNERVDAYGYPAAGKFNGQSLYMCDSYVSRIDTTANPDTYGIPCGMTGGSSGGGWVDDHGSEETNSTYGQLVSVNSYGYQGLKDTMFGPLHDGVAADLLAAAEGTPVSTITGG